MLMVLPKATLYLHKHQFQKLKFEGIEERVAVVKQLSSHHWFPTDLGDKVLVTLKATACTLDKL
jgi:hypothetical protein